MASSKSLFGILKEPIWKISIVSLAFLLSPIDVAATSFLPSWIGSAQSAKGAQVWFRKDYFFDRRPLNGYITIATTGYAKVFVNGRNVSTDVLTPARTESDSGAVAVVLDVTRFLKAHDNTVAVWFSPHGGGSDAQQVALTLYGKEHDGRSYSYSSEGDWLCRQAPVRTDEDGYEHIDGRESAIDWLGEEYAPALWTNAVEVAKGLDGSRTSLFEMPKEQRIAYKTVRSAHTLRPKYFDICGDSVVYDFGTAAQGWLRVTLRDTKRDEQIVFGNIRYTCSGQSDEQIIQRFSTTNARRILVFGDENFARQQIINVELTTTEEHYRLLFE